MKTLKIRLVRASIQKRADNFHIPEVVTNYTNHLDITCILNINHLILATPRNFIWLKRVCFFAKGIQLGIYLCIRNLLIRIACLHSRVQGISWPATDLDKTYPSFIIALNTR